MINFFIFIRSGLFFFLMSVATVVHGTLGLCTLLLPFSYRYQFITLWSRYMIWFAKVICGIRYEVVGLENLKCFTSSSPLVRGSHPTTKSISMNRGGSAETAPMKSAIVFCKHQSAWETLAMQVLLPTQSVVMKRELLRIPFFGWALSLLEPIAIDRSDRRGATEQIISQGKERLEQGRWVVIFPEGTRLPPRTEKRFTKTGALLAQETGYPVIPIALNSGSCWPRRGFMKRPGIVRVVIGQPIDTTGLKAEEINQMAKDWIDRTMVEIET